jgi:YbgC/YbaW family acyl-CoA thioester hydrolase
MVHRTELQMRFSDTDAMGHVNNISFASYAETGRIDFLKRLGKAVTSIILANVTIDYRRQVSYGESLCVDTWVESLGKSSIIIGQTIWANDERAADVRSVAVHFDYQTGKAVEITEAIRKELEPMLKSP